MKNKSKILLLLLMSFLFIKPANSFASSKEIELEEIDIEKEKTQAKDDEKKEEIKEEIKETKQEETKKDSKNNKITENIGSDGHIYNGDKRHENRQFLTFTTKAGKNYYLIIDYTKESEQVQFLTEINENEMANIIKEMNKSNGGSKEDKDKEKELKKEDLENFKEELKKELEKSGESDSNSKTKKSKSSGSSILSLDNLLLGGFVIGIGGFFFYKKRQKDKELQELQEAESIEDEDSENFDDIDEDEE